MARPNTNPPPPAPISLRQGGPVIIFTDDDIGRFESEELPFLQEGKGQALIKRLNDAFDWADAAVRIDALHTPNNKRIDRYNSVAARAQELLRALGYGQAANSGSSSQLSALETNVVSTDWRRMMIDALPSPNENGFPPPEYGRLARTALPFEIPFGSEYDDHTEKHNLGQKALEERLRVIAVIDSIPAALSLLVTIAQEGARDLAEKSAAKVQKGKKSGGGNRPDAYRGMLMSMLAKTYRDIYEVNPVRDTERGERDGPAAKWIEVVAFLAGTRARDGLLVAQDSVAVERIVKACACLTRTLVDDLVIASRKWEDFKRPW